MHWPWKKQFTARLWIKIARRVNVFTKIHTQTHKHARAHAPVAGEASYNAFQSVRKVEGELACRGKALAKKKGMRPKMEVSSATHHRRLVLRPESWQKHRQGGCTSAVPEIEHEARKDVGGSKRHLGLLESRD